MSEAARLMVGILFLALSAISVFAILKGTDPTGGLRSLQPKLSKIGIRMLPSDAPYQFASWIVTLLLAAAGLAMLVSLLL